MPSAINKTNVRDFSLWRKAERIIERLKMVSQVKNDADEAVMFTEQMPAVIDLIENIEDFSMNIRQKANRYYDILLSVRADKFISTTGDNAFQTKYMPMFRQTILIETSEYFIKLTMFPLIKNISAKTKHFITQCIDDAIRAYKRNEENPALVKFSTPAVLAVCTKRPRWDKIYDADNVEVNAIINALTPYFFTDDSPRYLSVYRMGMEASVASTEIFLMRLTDFPSWIKRHQASF